ncbi:phytanoyl-CoA dioxygenase family protein [Roseobacter sp.]|uniref:phytanoyl-CoA dioxygenase family protein n=1 Tax=Roseobacter sp. TaxID=1907202 RepID=UPI0029663309|nr:phytanoyl-CoA dioxygenase family protein [Roseobacter sp.]MDW3183415.1 phytanoyl-CoA dioxygenase family protein [Roseobacter sp.]
MKDRIELESGYYAPNACDLQAFLEIVQRKTRAADVPQATDIQKNVPIYDMKAMLGVLDSPDERSALFQEWANILLTGPGVLVLAGAYQQTDVLDQATGIYEAIIAEEKQANGAGGDHFATAGANDRIWNSLQKLCDRAPEVYLDYFSNASVAAVCEAWLGLGFQMTAQVNVVYPGGAAQEAHRDYHLGFLTAGQAASYPAHVHVLSPVLTLQGGIAHCDMPVESGPTKLLPFSQTYRPGYTAFRREDFRACFEEHCVQVPLSKGDAIFFNPALFHAAGENRTKDIHRMANLLQISSAFGRAMETVDRSAMCKRLYPMIAAALSEGRLSEDELAAVIACTAEGYAFPTNLDSDPPTGGLAPETQAAFFARALKEGMDAESFAHRIDAMDAKRQA